MRIAGWSRRLALCGEEAAPPVVVERNALTLWVVLARLLARLKVGLFGTLQVDLAFVMVAFLAVDYIGGYCEGQAEREDHAK